ncbi:MULTISPECIES: hypothetical protein [Francisella]|uniref:Uncharacterized protein n=1 Tax=Francisella salina TaxID=573569 RepID=A0ABN3ZK31_FRAST|nr:MULTISPECIES: hypothetical protein [Francisella]AEI35222.1 hypothetical protein F7308_0294 [Francisella salina]MBK2256679.1 hypothetical protein [Francisella philomiragia]MBK2269337.1 hypothetical protein [Francisella philomiragia]MBK2271298.1 hypothetical protein [Francisella philomiragia]MBK2275078.1 hypothetical protein [Francisella philomiragia]
MSLEKLLSQQVVEIIQPIVDEYSTKLKSYDMRVNTILDLPITPKQIALVLNYKTNKSVDRLFELGKLKNISTNSTRMATVQDVLNYKNSIEK